ncbi:MAG: MotA/TolQ/ExbB proton channel family protein [Pseudomonadales bacterium]
MLLDWLQQSEMFVAGGWVLVAIAAASIAMWALILERYLFLYRVRPNLVRNIVDQWHRQYSSDPVVNTRLREGLTNQFHGHLLTWVGTINVITAVLPLLGLLGTVIGMIKTFEVMTVFGNGNLRGMADGISQALITTMAGLLTAIAGMYFANDLQNKVERETEHLAEVLNADNERILRARGAPT